MEREQQEHDQIETKVPRVWRGTLSGIKMAADWAGVDPDQLVGMVLHSWLEQRGLIDLAEGGAIPSVDWARASLLRQHRGTAQSYSEWRRDGFKLLDGEGNIGA